MEEIKIVLHTAPRTKKNSQRIVKGRNGQPFLIPSKAYEDYCEKCGYLLGRNKNKKINAPVNIKCLFFMETRRRVDLTNLLEAIDDILVKYHVIEDDGYNIVQSHDGSRVLFDKLDPRVEIYITDAER